MHYLNCLNNINNFEDSKSSLENLGLFVKEYDNHYLVKYIKDKSDMTNEDVQKCRGIILEKNTNRLLCVPPPKSVSLDMYHNIFKNNENNENIVFEEFVDGTMINLFKHNDETYISTRSCLGANCRWNSKNTFNYYWDKKYNALFLWFGKDYLKIINNVEF